MTPNYTTLIVSFGLFIGMVLLAQLGHQIGARDIARGQKASSGILDSAIFALFALLLAFSFSGATSRFDARRYLIIEETNIIGTTYSRIDLLPATDQPALRELMRNYLDSRISAYKKLPDLAAFNIELNNSIKLQDQIWVSAIKSLKAQADPAATTLLITTLNEMFDIVTERTNVAKIHPPRVIFILLMGVGLLTALIAGYGLGEKGASRWLHIICFSLVVTLTVYITIDIEYPRLGFITVEDSDQILIDLREKMN